MAGTEIMNPSLYDPYDLTSGKKPPEDKTVDEDLRQQIADLLVSVDEDAHSDACTDEYCDYYTTGNNLSDSVDKALDIFHSYAEKREAALLAKPKQEQSK